MRTIKFRAWDVVNKKMTLVLHLRHNGSEAEVLEKDGDTHGHILHFSKGKDPIGFGYLMQFTGLTDKNGKEIYEGDIVVKYHTETKKEIGNHHQPVKVHWSGHNCGWNLRGVKTIYYEVIGNIYENSELLKGHQEDN